MAHLKGDSVIDSRDLIERLEELQAERDTLSAAMAEAQADFEKAPGVAELRVAVDTAVEEMNDWSAEYSEELAELESLAEQAEGYGDWSHGETLVLESHFTKYAQELAEECGMVSESASWPNNCIDWEEAARQLKFDYTEVDFGGETYLMRA